MSDEPAIEDVVPEQGPELEEIVRGTETPPHDVELEERLAALEAALTAIPVGAINDLIERVRQISEQMSDLQPVADAVRELRREEMRPRDRKDSWFTKKLW